ncbi:hypothetical protein SAMN03080617_03097 [Algoriphagus alkaliphilus]|uniref:Uncharacterized protein n=1 Tax=Algoriphagus alkaliphilus TaxID=279824 RepID=A0A1G5Z1Q4_9BACT|nr:hypothetical protein [Algoriphagus alkaliphilus]MBA4300826.1 hypothetical protein [Cyclobacterium sp.]SDA88674.1 hypothetical protein SAMN03080617_03097 [Algoriphagus alkaliphilus]
MRKPEQELAEIKSMMERSTRFLSLSGLAGVLAGIYAFVGAGIAYYWIYFPASTYGKETVQINRAELQVNLLAVALVVLVLAIGTAYLLSQQKSQRNSQQFWSPASKRFLLALFIPVISGGLFSFALIHQSAYELIAPATLIFYGLGLINASHFTLGEIKNLGIGQLFLGILAAFFPDFGLIYWAIGFGILHVIYGSMMYYKHDR